MVANAWMCNINSITIMANSHIMLFMQATYMLCDTTVAYKNMSVV